MKTKKRENKIKPLEREFVKEYLSNGNIGSKAAQTVFSTNSIEVAGVKANRLLKTDKIKNEIEKYLPDSLLGKKHLSLLNQKQLSYFTFPKTMEDEEITDHVISAGLKVVNIRYSDKGKLAFYSNDDAQAISKGLDMAYKLKNKYPKEGPNVAVQINMRDESHEFK